MEIKRTLRMEIRLNEHEQAVIAECAHAACMKVSDWVRYAAMQASIKAARPKPFETKGEAKEAADEIVRAADVLTRKSSKLREMFDSVPKHVPPEAPSQKWDGE